MPQNPLIKVNVKFTLEEVTKVQRGCKGTALEGKAAPLQAWSDPEGSRKLRFPDFMTTAQDGGKVVSLTHRPPLPPSKHTWYSFLLEAESTPGL
jgi:hypothetical protein